MNYYTGEIVALLREHGFAGTAKILADRKKAEQENRKPVEQGELPIEQGDASELSKEEFEAAIEANKRDKK